MDVFSYHMNVAWEANFEVSWSFVPIRDSIPTTDQTQPVETAKMKVKFAKLVYRASPVRQKYVFRLRQW